MADPRLLILVLTSFFVPGGGHAILTSPVPRSNSVGDGIKLQPFGDARSVASTGCGSTANADPGVSVPTVAYRPGEVMAVTWQLTIPHTADNRDTGVRIAMHYGPGDSFDRNVHRSFQLASVAPHSPCPAVV